MTEMVVAQQTLPPTCHWGSAETAASIAWKACQLRLHRHLVAKR